MSGFFFARGHWDRSVALHQIALTAARQAGDRLSEANTLDGLGVLQGSRGDYPAATASARQALAVARSARNRSVEADVGLSLTAQRPSGSAQLHDIEAGDDTVVDGIGALIGVDG